MNRYPLAISVLLAWFFAMLAVILCAVWSPATAHGKTVRASTYGGPNDHCGSSIAAPHAGHLKRSRNIIAMRHAPFGTLYRITYRNRSQLCIVLDRGPFCGGRQVDISYGAAARLHFSGVGHVRMTRAGKLPRRLWRAFKSYRDLRECRRKLRFR